MHTHTKHLSTHVSACVGFLGQHREGFVLNGSCVKGPKSGSVMHTQTRTHTHCLPTIMRKIGQTEEAEAQERKTIVISLLIDG